MRRANEAVTVVVTHSVKPGREQEFEEWLRGIGHTAARFAGYRGYVAVPQANASQERHVAFRFDSLRELEAFWSSSDCEDWREKLDELVTEPSRYHKELGLEHWFMASGTGIAPSRHRMTVVVFFAILPLVTFIPSRLTPWLAGHLPSWLAGVLTTTVLVILMSYVAVPLVARLLQPWLQPSMRTTND